MLAYLLKRLLAMVPTLLGITFVTFLIVNLAPGDPVATAFGSDSGGGPSAEGGGAEQDRLADAIKAKKKLLGMVTEDRTLHVWVPPASGEDLRPMEQTERVGEFVGWARSLDMAGDSLAVGSDTGELLRMGLDGEVQQTLAGHDDPIWVVRLAADGRLLSSDTGGAIKLWSSDGAELAVAAGAPSTPPRKRYRLANLECVAAVAEAMCGLRVCTCVWVTRLVFSRTKVWE